MKCPHCGRGWFTAGELLGFVRDVVRAADAFRNECEALLRENPPGSAMEVSVRLGEPELFTRARELLHKYSKPGSSQERIAP